MDPLQKLNEDLRQRAHAEKVEARTAERRQTPEQRANAALEATVGRIVDAKVNAAIVAYMAGFSIQAGQGITSSGTGRNITIGSQNAPNQTNGQGPNSGAGVGYDLELCDGTVIKVVVLNVTPP